MNGLGFLSAHDYIAQMQALCTSHPNVAASQNIGSTHNGNPLWIFGFGTGYSKSILISSCHHGSEGTRGAANIMFLAKWLLSTDPVAVAGLKTHRFVFFPIVNYDSYGSQRKNHGTPYNVDLNRNYAVGWGGDQATTHSNIPTSDFYRGPNPASEVETQRMRWLFKALNPILYVDIHDGNGSSTTLGYWIYPKYVTDAAEKTIITNLWNQYSAYIKAYGSKGPPHSLSYFSNPYGAATDDAYSMMSRTNRLSLCWEESYFKEMLSTYNYEGTPLQGKGIHGDATISLITNYKQYHLRAWAKACMKLL